MTQLLFAAALALGPAAFILDHAGASASLIFLLAAAGTIPAAFLLGKSTEEISAGIASRSGSGGGDLRGAKIGGLLNATFGNITELIVGVLALQQGFTNLVKASIIGSVLGNITLVLGLALLAGGLRNGVQRFDAQEVGHHAVLMVLTVAAMALPSLFLTTHNNAHAAEISEVTAGILLIVYCAYLLYSIAGVQGGTENKTYIDEEADMVRELHGPEHVWPLRLSISLLALSTLLVFLSAEALIGTVESVSHRLGWSPVFVGIVVIPVIANVAEHSSAVQLAIKNKTNMAFGVASGSSIQVAVFVTPLLVFLSLFWHRLDLVFSSIEIAALTVAVAVFYLIARDGESNWLEGLQLFALYVLAGTIFFYVPGHL